MLFVGITGPIGHGKTTFAEALLSLRQPSLHLESNMPIIEVANAWQAALPVAFDPHDITALNEWVRELPAILQDLFGVTCTFEQIEIHTEEAMASPVEYQKLLRHAELLADKPELASVLINNDNKEQYRPLLQWLGGYLPTRLSPSIWYDEVVRRAQAFANKGGELCVSGGIRYPVDAEVWRKAGGKIIKVYRPGKLESDLLDPTERQRESIVPNTTVVNDGTIADLHHVAVSLLQDIEQNHLRSEYQASHK